MTNSPASKLSEPMQKVLMKLGKGWGWADFEVDGPLSYAARIRTCVASLSEVWWREYRAICLLGLRGFISWRTVAAAATAIIGLSISWFNGEGIS